MRYIIFPDVLCFSFFIIAGACLKESRTCCTFSCSILNDVQKDIFASYNVLYSVQWGHWYGQNAPNYVDKQIFLWLPGFERLKYNNNSKKLYIRQDLKNTFLEKSTVL